MSRTEEGPQAQGPSKGPGRAGSGLGRRSHAHLRERLPWQGVRDRRDVARALPGDLGGANLLQAEAGRWRADARRGLSMNNPDVLALTEVARRWPERLPQLEMLSIGT